MLIARIKASLKFQTDMEDGPLNGNNKWTRFKFSVFLLVLNRTWLNLLVKGKSII